MTQDREIIRTVVHSVTILILVRDDIQTPVETVFNSPVRTDDGVEPFGGHRLAEQIAGRLDGSLGGRLPRTGNLTDAFQPGPSVIMLKSPDVGRDSGRPGFDPPIIGIDGGIGVAGLTLGIIEKQDDIGM